MTLKSITKINHNIIFKDSNGKYLFGTNEYPKSSLRFTCIKNLFIYLFANGEHNEHRYSSCWR